MHLLIPNRVEGSSPEMVTATDVQNYDTKQTAGRQIPGLLELWAAPPIECRPQPKPFAVSSSTCQSSFAVLRMVMMASLFSARRIRKTLM